MMKAFFIIASQNVAIKTIRYVYETKFTLVACNLLHDQITHGTLFNLSGTHDFMRSVHLDARPTHPRKVISPFRAFTISCVACNLLHEQTTHGTLFNLSGIHDFVQQVARYD